MKQRASSPIQTLNGVPQGEGVYYVTAEYNDGRSSWRVWSWFTTARGARKYANEATRHLPGITVSDARWGSLTYAELLERSFAVPTPQLPPLDSSFVMVSQPCRKNAHNDCPGMGTYGETTMPCECTCGHKGVTNWKREG